MIKNLEVVGAFSAKKIFPEKIIFDDLPPPPPPPNNTISHKIDRIGPIFLYYKPILPDCEANIVRKIDLA
jgi:hypothetical protein